MDGSPLALVGVESAGESSVLFIPGDIGQPNFSPEEPVLPSGSSRLYWEEI